MEVPDVAAGAGGDVVGKQQLPPDVHQGEAAVCRPRLHQLPRLRQGPPPADLHLQKGLQAGLKPPCRLQDQVLSAVHRGIIYKYC